VIVIVIAGIVAVACFIFAFLGALFRALLIDEIKGLLANRRDEIVDQAIATLGDEDRALFEDDWRGTYEKCRARPFSAWRCSRELRFSAKKLVNPDYEPLGVAERVRAGIASVARYPFALPHRHSVVVQLACGSRMVTVMGCVWLAAHDLAGAGLVTSVLLTVTIGVADRMAATLPRTTPKRSGSARVLVALVSLPNAFMMAKLEIFKADIDVAAMARFHRLPTGLLERSSLLAAGPHALAMSVMVTMMMLTLIMVPVILVQPRPAEY
jgi:hypothetical protein